MCGGAKAVPTRWSAQFDTPRGWFSEALCIHQHEGAWNDATGNGYEGGMQFLPSTYASVGGRVVDRSGRVLVYSHNRFNGYPWHWASLDPPREQLYRAYLVWRRDGHSWGEWGTRGVCGV